ncbi:efflux RND transporter periplasmic adaptor subunit [Rivularia sp. UHCC 0363]|uniref:efflux RND transporter periplasmic adaptor subunit n=1 Tax=Rivularia sp. UHCC 0363 TaxID=3110244 RepID=UPI002B21251D|nr:efflux RND transporter periplasmic adaptor subunit [Rivularia sp. UHCC 0363]MEA5595522.1 efflux RND transporter periplasmic adaptor subunit [Rivularia sp. UHCC 0363]
MKSPESQTKLQGNNPQKPVRSPLWQRLLLILLPVTLTVGGVVILWHLLARKNNSSPTTTVQQPAVSVKLAEVQPGQIKESSEFIASLQSLRSASLQANTQGKVSQIFVKVGSKVAAEAPLLQINSNNQPIQISNTNSSNSITLQTTQQQIQNANNQLQVLESQRLLLLKDVTLNQQKYDKYTDLAAQGAVSRQIKDDYEQQLAAAKTILNNLDTQIQAQRVTVSNLEKAFQQVQANPGNKISQPTPLQDYKINAPFTGTVANISVKVGDLVNPSTRVATVTQNQPLEVDIPVSFEKKTQLSKGMPVELLDAKSENIGMGKVFFIAPEVNDNTRTVLVKALFDNTEGKMQAGQFARARINWNQSSGLLIPTQAVFRIAGEAFVYVVESNSTAATPQLVAKQKQVKLGKIVDNKYQVIEGLQPGEKVVVSKLLNIKDGEIVMAQ